MTADAPQIDPRRHVSEYVRLERYEVPAPPGDERPPRLVGRTPVDPHLRGAGGGIRTGALLTSLDSLGGFTAGLAALPRWIVTTSLQATVSTLAHAGPLRIDAAVLRRGRNSVVTALEVVDEGRADHHVAHATMTCAVLVPDGLELEFERPVVIPMPAASAEQVDPVEFFCVEPGEGPVTRLRLDDSLRNPWGILHGGAVAMLADEAACRAAVEDTATGPEGVAAADVVLHYLSPARVGPVEARCRVLGTRAGRTTVRMTLHDIGAGDRTVAAGMVVVVAV